jgi:putative hemolysin
LIVKFLKWLFGLSRIEAVYSRAASGQDHRKFFSSMARDLEIGLDLSDEDRRRIPSDGPLIVVANHPTGGMDGILLNALLQSIRDDLKILSHLWFKDYPALTRHMIFVNPVGKSVPKSENVGSIRDAVRWVRRGGMLMVYPAGSVSYFQWRNLAVSDPPWQSAIAHIIRLTRATILPVHLGSRNSLLFQIAAAIHPALRMPLLAREILNKRGKTIRMRVGQPIPYDHFPPEASDDVITSYLRHATYQLAE